MKELPLTSDAVAQLDDKDYEKAKEYHWYLDFHHSTSYAKTDQIEGRPRLHNFILPSKGNLVVNHIDGDGLNNQRSNLELVTPSVNSAKAKRRGNATGKYRGVEFNGYVYFARITVNYKRHYLGSFKSAKAAAKAFNEASLRLRGPGFPLNSIKETHD